MKLVKSLLLGSAAGLAAAAGVQAADLPVKKAAAVEYVRVCSTYGAGFFYIPGTESCLRIGGRVRADYLYNEPFNRAQDAFGFRVRGRVQLDHRTETAYGLLRSFIRFEITRNSGTGFVANGQIATTPDVAEAFIQFGGLTAGRTISFFDNPDLPTEHFGTLRFSDAPDVSVLAYTYSFGNGFSATLSIEDGLERRVNSVPFGLNLVPVDSPVPFFAPFGYTIGGQRMPDVVANVRYSGTWGSAQLAGAAHQIRDVGGAGLLNPITGTALPDFADTDYGFAIGAQAGINLPFLGAGDTAWLALTYTDGATGYILGGTGESFGAGDLSLPITDAYIDPFTGDFKETKAWSVAGGFTHNWTPEFRTSLFGSYARFDVPGSAGFVVPVTPISIAAGTAGTTVGFIDFNELRLGGNAIWSPISGLNLGVEAIYVKLDPRGRVFIPVTNVAGTVIGGKPSGSEDIWEGRLRVQRDF
jgi:hypothetical protein